jgi:hypothetical protein
VKVDFEICTVVVSIHAIDIETIVEFCCFTWTINMANFAYDLCANMYYTKYARSFFQFDVTPT